MSLRVPKGASTRRVRGNLSGKRDCFGSTSQWHSVFIPAGSIILIVAWGRPCGQLQDPTLAGTQTFRFRAVGWALPTITNCRARSPNEPHNKGCSGNSPYNLWCHLIDDIILNLGIKNTLKTYKNVEKLYRYEHKIGLEKNRKKIS